MAKKIKIDPALYEKLVAAAERAGYASVDEMIAHVLEREAAKSESKETQDEEQAEKQLRGLGYIE